MKGQRHRFSREESAWISTQLQELPRDAVRSTDQWQSLYAAFLAKFPDSQGTTLHHYKAHVKYLDSRGPPTQLTRVQQHLRGYEERSKERKRQRRRRRLESEGRGEEYFVKEEEDTTARGEDLSEEEPEEEETVDLEYVATSMEMRIKTETVEATGPRPTPRPLLRTKASADALAVGGSSKRKFGVLRRTYGMYNSDVEEEDNNRARVRKFGVRRDGGAITASPLPATTVVSSTVPTRPLITPGTKLLSTVKRQREELQPSTVSRAAGSSSESAAEIKLKMVELQLRDAQHAAEQWKTKYETTDAQLTSEKSTSKVLQSRLDEALAMLRATQKKLERVEALTPTTVTMDSGGGSGSGGGQTPTSFTIRVNVDVSQNGERLQTSSQTLSVDAGSRRGSESPVFC